MYTTKFCSIEDLESISKIIDSKELLSYNTITEESKEKIKKYIESKISSESDLDKVAGLFDNNSLIGFHVLKLSAYHNVWYSKFLYMNHPKINNLSLTFLNNGFRELKKFAFDYAESKGYFECLTCTSAKQFNRYFNLFNRYQERYEFMVEYFYPANSPIKFQHHKDFLGKSNTDVEIIFHKMNLKPEHRLPLVFNDEKLYNFYKLKINNKEKNDI